MRASVIILMLLGVALIYYLVALYAPSIGSSLDRIPMETIY